jgi:hypothetical protein
MPPEPRYDPSEELWEPEPELEDEPWGDDFEAIYETPAPVNGSTNGEAHPVMPEPKPSPAQPGKGGWWGGGPPEG